jgi:ATP-dependent exoDNAse (exonuclease V) beta subunit
VRSRPDAAIASSHTVSPGLHAFELRDGERYDVVWWDPHALTLGVDTPFGLRRQELIARDVAPEVVAARQRDYIAWREGRAEALAGGRTPTLRVRTATEIASDGAIDDRIPVELIELERSGDRPQGQRFGTLVHAVLATVPLDASVDTIRAIVATQARIVAATAEETASAVDVVAAALRHPLLEAARRAAVEGNCLREVPLTTIRAGELIEGTADFAFRQDGATTVIDFKTDRPDAERLAVYQRQVGVYAEALATVTGGPVRAVLLLV